MSIGSSPYAIMKCFDALVQYADVNVQLQTCYESVCVCTRAAVCYTDDDL